MIVDQEYLDTHPETVGLNIGDTVADEPKHFGDEGFPTVGAPAPSEPSVEAAPVAEETTESEV